VTGGGWAGLGLGWERANDGEEKENQKRKEQRNRKGKGKRKRKRKRKRRRIESRYKGEPSPHGLAAASECWAALAWAIGRATCLPKLCHNDWLVGAVVQVLEVALEVFRTLPVVAVLDGPHVWVQVEDHLLSACDRRMRQVEGGRVSSNGMQLLQRK